MFRDIFEKIAKQVNDIISIGIWGLDGLELDNYILNKSEINFELFGAEAADIIKKVYSTKEKNYKFLIKIDYKKRILVLFPANKEFFYMIFAENNVIINKLEFYLGLFNNDVVKRIS